MKLFVDDVRNPPDDTWVVCRTFDEAISHLNNGVTEISLDHDLGEDKTGYDIAKYIERLAYENKLGRIKWAIHSANPVGRQNIERALKSAERFWFTGELNTGQEYILSDNYLIGKRPSHHSKKGV